MSTITTLMLIENNKYIHNCLHMMCADVQKVLGDAAVPC